MDRTKANALQNKILDQRDADEFDVEPVRVFAVTGADQDPLQNIIVVVQDNQTGEQLYVRSHEHWRELCKHKTATGSWKPTHHA